MEVESFDGTRLAVRVFGPESGPTVVLAHGYTQQMRMWAYQVHDLSERYRVVLYDQRGHGASAWAPPATYTVASLGDDLHAVLTACVPADQRAVIVGHSMGGITIMSWAARHPEEVGRAAAVVLVNTLASELARHVRFVGRAAPVRGAVTSMVRKQLLAIAMAGARRPVRLLALGKVAHRVHLDAILEFLRATPAPVMREFMRDMFAMDLTSHLDRLTVPALVIGGEADGLVPPIHNRNLEAALPSLDKLVMLPGSGHMSPWEERAVVSDLIADAALRHLQT
jgi:pimeloyl-ACP methyl ester carboxylesterase